MSAPADAPSWVDELDLHAGGPEAAMGTRALDPARWVLVDGDWSSQRDESRRLLRERRADVLATSRASDLVAAGVEVA